MAATNVKRSVEAPPSRAEGLAERPPRTRFSRELALYIARGIAVYSVVAFVILETVLGVTGTVRATEEFNVDFLIILPVLLRAMAQAINYTLPVSLLFGCGLLIGRMRADRELLSIASFGISPFQIVLPVALVGSVLSGVMYPYVDHVVPGFRYQNRNVATLIMDQLPYLGEGFNLEFSQPPHHIWIRHYIGAELYGVLITLGGETGRNRDDKGPLSSDALEDVDSATYPLYLFAASARLSEDTGDSGEYLIELRDVSIFMDSDFFGGDIEFDFVQRGYMSSWTVKIPARRKRRGIKDRTGPVLREFARSQLELHDELMARLEKKGQGADAGAERDDPPPDPEHHH